MEAVGTLADLARIIQVALARLEAAGHFEALDARRQSMARQLRRLFGQLWVLARLKPVSMAIVVEPYGFHRADPAALVMGAPLGEGGLKGLDSVGPTESTRRVTIGPEALDAFGRLLALRQALPGQPINAAEVTQDLIRLAEGVSFSGL